MSQKHYTLDECLQNSTGKCDLYVTVEGSEIEFFRFAFSWVIRFALLETMLKHNRRRRKVIRR
jgi:hypothetical protein